MVASSVQRIYDHLVFVYGVETADRVAPLLSERLNRFAAEHPQRGGERPADERLTERDAILITYGDQVQEPGRSPLQSLRQFLTDQTAEVLSGVHILPFYPYTSDDGFSVVDYTAVDPNLGDWADVVALARHFRLMFDAVINHISATSDWFQKFQLGQAHYTDYFITVDPAVDLSQVVRPRTLPLLTPVETVHGVKHVWTTFSADQIDINYANPQVLLEIVDVLLHYVSHSAELIRLDAIGFMWKEIGTSCIHLPQAHRLIQLLRDVLDAVAPHVLLVTETNVPHAENISYFGDGFNEAQMVYNFTLPPLTLHTFATGDATALTSWASTLTTPSDQTTYFNFMASHDGIGLRPLEGILSRAEVDILAERTQRHGGFVSYKANPDGSQSPYELNITYFDAINRPDADEPQSLQVDRFIASQAILVGMAGVPGIYFHSLFGSRNWRAGVEQTGRNRTINRQKFERIPLENELADPMSLRHQVFARYRQLLAARRGDAAFYPNGGQRILAGDRAIFAFLRGAPDGSSRVLCLHNVTDSERTLSLDEADLGAPEGGSWRNLLGPEQIDADARTLTVPLAPYQVLWLRQGKS
jgi:glucosylglycerate phosphorylase